jgi:hypothetical protein
MSDRKPHSDARISARFKAKYLHALRYILDNAEAHFYRTHYGLFVEPAPDGGVILVACEGRALAAIHDASGVASRPFHAFLPKQFRDRCGPPEPVTFDDDIRCAVDMPEWAQPGDIHLTDDCASLFPQMDHPEFLSEPPALARAMPAIGRTWRADEYRADDGPFPDWRKIFEAERAPASRAFLAPGLYAAFEPLRELSADAHDGIMPSASIAFGGESAAAIVTIDGLPNFVGAIMPMTPFDAPLPSFIRRVGAIS